MTVCLYAVPVGIVVMQLWNVDVHYDNHADYMFVSGEVTKNFRLSRNFVAVSYPARVLLTAVRWLRPGDAGEVALTRALCLETSLQRASFI
jgi:hypothetical protein